MQSGLFTINVTSATGLVVITFDDDLGLRPDAYGRIFQASRNSERAADPFAHNHPIVETLLNISGVASVTPYATYVRIVVGSNLQAVTREACDILSDYLEWPSYTTDVDIDKPLNV